MDKTKNLLIYKSLLAGLTEYESQQVCSLLFNAAQGRLYTTSLQTGDFHQIELVPEDEADEVDRELGGLRFKELE